MDRLIARPSMLAACLFGMPALFAAPGQAHVQERGRIAQPAADVKLIEMAEQACYERITKEDRVLPADVRIESASREASRVTVYGVVRQPAPGGPMAFVCTVSGYGGTGGVYGQVFSLQYSRIEAAG
jgi:hypothetical protein